MSDIIGSIEVVLFLGCLVTAIPYLIWVLFTAWKRRWRRLMFQIVSPAIAYFAVAATLGVLHRLEYHRYLSNTFAASVSFDEPLFVYDSPRAFNGDGYSIEVYSLPTTIEQRFREPDERLLSTFPRSYPKSREIA